MNPQAPQAPVANSAVTVEGESYPSPRLQYVDVAVPESGTGVEIAPQVHWCRIPMPIDLDHINVWLLDCGDGYVLVDTGLASPIGMDAWQSLAGQLFAAKPLRAILVTHIHPDHIGLAAWLQQRYQIPVLMSRRTFEQAEIALRGLHCVGVAEVENFFRSHGMPDASAMLAAVSPQRFAKLTSGMPDVARHILDEEVLQWGGRWTALETNGHAAGHLCLSNAEARLLISGDQVLPTISSNIGFTLGGGDDNPLHSYLSSLQRLRSLDRATLVLPSHGVPFRGLQLRIDDLLQHHAGKLELVVAACAVPKTAVEMLAVMFRRTLKGIHLFLALTEALAHLEYLAHAGRLQRKTDPQGTIRYASA